MTDMRPIQRPIQHPTRNMKIQHPTTATGAAWKTIESMTVEQIAWLLRDDGYPPGLASRVRQAAASGCLLWTRERLVTTDASRIDCRPAR